VKQSSRFIAWWVQSAENHDRGPRRRPSEPQWLVCELPDDEKSPTKFWLAALPKNTSLVALVRLAKLRWRVERYYQELKQEIGLTITKAVPGAASITTPPSVRWPTVSSPSAGRFSPRRRKWTLALVRRQLQQVLLRWIGYCPLCRRPVTGLDPPLGPSRM